MHFTGQFTLTVSRAQKGTSYKYVIIKKGNVVWEELVEFQPRFREDIIDRYLYIPSKYLKQGGEILALFSYFFQSNLHYTHGLLSTRFSSRRRALSSLSRQSVHTPNQLISSVPMVTVMVTQTSNRYYTVPVCGKLILRDIMVTVMVTQTSNRYYTVPVCGKLILRIVID